MRIEMWVPFLYPYSTIFFLFEIFLSDGDPRYATIVEFKSHKFTFSQRKWGSPINTLTALRKPLNSLVLSVEPKPFAPGYRLLTVERRLRMLGDVFWLSSDKQIHSGYQSCWNNRFSCRHHLKSFGVSTMSVFNRPFLQFFAVLENSSC